MPFLTQPSTDLCTIYFRRKFSSRALLSYISMVDQRRPPSPSPLAPMIKHYTISEYVKEFVDINTIDVASSYPLILVFLGTVLVLYSNYMYLGPVRYVRFDCNLSLMSRPCSSHADLSKIYLLIMLILLISDLSYDNDFTSCRTRMSISPIFNMPFY